MHKYKCVYCGREFEAKSSGRKYCSHECYICERFNKTPAEVRRENTETSTKKTVDDDEDKPGVFVLKDRTPEEEKAYVEKFRKNNPGVMRNMNFVMTMTLCRQMFEKDLITAEEYWKFYDLMVEKYHPNPQAELLYMEPYEATNTEKWKKYHDKVPYRHIKEKPDQPEETNKTAEIPASPEKETDAGKNGTKRIEKTIHEEVPAVESQPEEKLFVADEIKKLKELLDCGALTQEEFDLQKKKLLNI